jgi:hypothetical protein
MSQLGLDGTGTTYPVRKMRPLSDRQRELVAYMRHEGDVRPVDVGKMMRAGRETPVRRGGERHASSDGVDALRRLERRGLVERVARARWRAVEHDEEWFS